MALTVKMLKGLGLTDEQREAILEEHANTVSEIKTERDRFKQDAEKLAEVQRQLDDLKENGNDGYKDKYEKEHQAFEDYKSGITAKEAKAAKEKAARAYLKSKGITDDASLDLAMMAASDEITKLEMDGEKIKDTAGLDGLLSGTLAKLVTHSQTEGTKTPTPAGTGGGSNYGDIYKKDDRGRYVMSTAERQKAIAEKMANESE